MINVVEDFGAIGDGITDDTTALAAAFATSGEVYLPAGRYRTTAELHVDPHRVAIRGDGPQCTVIAPELSAGQYALTLGWSGTVDHLGPYEAISGVSFQAPIGANQANCLRLNNGDPSPHAYGMVFRDMSIVGFDVQVELGNQVYLTRFDEVSFHSAWSYGVRLDNPTNAGEQLKFTGCTWSGGPGTGVYLNKSGASAFFHLCSFDYLKRAVWQRAGLAGFTNCHFEADTAYGPGGEFLRLDRNGQVSLPLMTLTDCSFYDRWDNYDTTIRITSSWYGGGAVRVTNPYITRTPTSCQYFLRDDALAKSNIVVTGAWYAQGGYPPPKLKPFTGADLVLAPTITHVVA